MADVPKGNNVWIPDGRTPYEAAPEALGEGIRKAFQLKRIAPDEVNLTPKLNRSKKTNQKICCRTGSNCFMFSQCGRWNLVQHTKFQGLASRIREKGFFSIFITLLLPNLSRVPPLDRYFAGNRRLNCY